MKKPSNPSGMKVLTLDIETSPHDVYSFQTFKAFIPPEFMKEPTRVIAWAAKWEHEDVTWYSSERVDDRETMIRDVYDMVNEADAIVHYNGTAFDMKHLNREFIELNLPPPEKYKNIDLYQVVKRLFKFPSYKLDYVAGVLLGEHKLETGGAGLWVRCLQGDKAAWRKMEEYNIADTELTERLYHKIQGWIPGHPNRALWVEDQTDPICPNCGGTHLIKKGVERPARVNAYQRYRCMDCGASPRGRYIVSKAGPGVLM